MEEKHPIKFTLSQFILLMGVIVVIFIMVFLLGARMGGQIFPEFYAGQFKTSSDYASLAPGERGGRVIEDRTSDKLVDTLADDEGLEEGDEGLGEDAPHFAVGPDGEKYILDEEEGKEAGEDYDILTINKSLIRTDADKDTMIRFKSSSHSKFTVEVADFFDELLASRKISILKKRGYEAYLHIKNPGAKSPTYSVRVGAFSDRTVAEDFASKMATRQNLELRVVRMD